MEDAQIVITVNTNDEGQIEIETSFYDLQPLYDVGPLELEKLVADNFSKAVSYTVKTELQKEYEDQMTHCVSEQNEGNR